MLSQNIHHVLSTLHKNEHEHYKHLTSFYVCLVGLGNMALFFEHESASVQQISSKSVD